MRCVDGVGISKATNRWMKTLEEAGLARGEAPLAAVTDSDPPATSPIPGAPAGSVRREDRAMPVAPDAVSALAGLGVRRAGRFQFPSNQSPEQLAAAGATIARIHP
ncbi:hypothetical protein VTN02DRAFT_2359 [Thermoascus thermophilus]